MHQALIIWLTTLILLGCGTSYQMHSDLMLKQIQANNYQAAEQSLAKSMSANGKDKLLYQLEMGMLKHLQGSFDKSNHHFHQAEQIIEQNFTTSISASISEILTGPTTANYKSFVFENTFINYYKALNYLKLAEQNESNLSAEQLDAAIVEIRRLGNRLRLLTNKTGGYQAKSSNQNEQITQRVFTIFSRALGNKMASQSLQYRDDAFAHYLSALLYEMGGELDDARIEYIRSAQAYENGYTRQYNLKQAITAEIWFDAIRIMKLDGGYLDEWPKLAKRKLTAPLQQKLAQLNPNDSELIILQHTGIAPKRRQLNLMLNADPATRSLVLTPILLGTQAEKRAQYQWFYMLYADTDIFDIIQNYVVGDLTTVLMGQFQKRIPLGPLWRDAERVGIIGAIGQGVRVSVPYYPPLQNRFIRSELFIDNQPYGELTEVNSIARIALQEQLRVANSQIQTALVREIAKGIIANKAAEVANQQGNAYLGLLVGGAAKIMNALTASADTRNWLSLPSGIQFLRARLPPGKHEIKISTTLENGRELSQTGTIETTTARPTLWHLRTFSSTKLNATNDGVSVAKNEHSTHSRSGAQKYEAYSK